MTAKHHKGRTFQRFLRSSNHWLLPLAVFFFTTSGRAAPALCAAPWQRLDRNAEELTRPRSLALLASAALPPLLMAPTGADHALRRFAQEDLGGSYHPESVSVVLPYAALPAVAAVWGTTVLLSACPAQKVPSAMLQGATWTIAVVALSKWVVGRQWPTAGGPPGAASQPGAEANATTFKPFQAGLAAFPSGHTAVMFALAAAIRSSAPEWGTARYLGYPVAAAIGFAMWYGDHHWASDVLSGALIGESLGGAAGRAWQANPNAIGLDYVLVPLPGGVGVGATGVF